MDTQLPESIQTLKAAALAREQAEEQKQRDLEAQKQERGLVITEAVASHAYNSFPALAHFLIPIQKPHDGELDGGSRIVVEFHIPAHAPIAKFYGVYVTEADLSDLQVAPSLQYGSEIPFQVMRQSCDWSEYGNYKYLSSNWYSAASDLGETLVIAERQFAINSEQQSALALFQLQQERKSVVAKSEPPTPEPGPDDILTDALRQFIKECVSNALAEREFA